MKKITKNSKFFRNHIDYKLKLFYTLNSWSLVYYLTSKCYWFSSMGWTHGRKNKKKFLIFFKKVKNVDIFRTIGQNVTKFSSFQCPIHSNMLSHESSLCFISSTDSKWFILQRIMYIYKLTSRKFPSGFLLFFEVRLFRTRNGKIYWKPNTS